MKKYQNFEFHKHKLSLIVQAIVVVPAHFYLTLGIIIESFTSACYRTQKSYNLTEESDFCQLAFNFSPKKKRETLLFL